MSDDVGLFTRLWGDLPTPILTDSLEGFETKITKKDVKDESKSKGKIQLNNTNMVIYFKSSKLFCDQFISSLRLPKVQLL